MRTEFVGVFAHHADSCPARGAKPCRCGPLGYRAGVWDWLADRWVVSPLVPTSEQAVDWQRAANRVAERNGPPPAPAQGVTGEDETIKASERVFWWAFCYIGLAFLGVGLALFASDIAG
jgi:hypothetical protein